MLLALVMVLTMALVAPVTADAAGSGVDYRILHLDNGRKYFTVDWVKALITEMKAAGFTHLELAFGNDGLRFLLDDMSVGSYSDAAVTAAIQNGNRAYNSKKGYSTSVNELTQAEMDQILAHAKAEGIEIIPLLNNPGHMYTLISAMTELGMTPGYNGSASTVDLQDSQAVSFVKGLLQKYVNYFGAKGCSVFNIGADEYANDIYSGGSMGFGNLMNSGKYQLFADYVNQMNDMIKSAGMKTMVFNDGIYFWGDTSYSFDRDIMISFWTSGWSGYNSASASTMAAMGHPMINTNGDYYYILGVNDAFTPGSNAYHADGYHTAAANFSNSTFMGSTVSNPAGSMFCVWADYPGAETETEVARYVRPILRVMGARMQNSSSYEVDSIVAGGFNTDGTLNQDASAPGNVTLTDDATGITVTAPGLTGLTVSQMAAPSVEDAMEGRVKAWTITASTDEGLYTGSAEVSVPVPAGWANAQVLGMEGTVKNGYITVDMSSLSNVVIYDRDTSVLVELERGESLTKTDTTGNYAPSYTGEGLDETVAAVTVTGKDGISETAVGNSKVTALENGATYIIRVYNTSYALSANSGRGDWGTTTRAYEYNALTANTAHMWTLEASGNGYKLKNSAGYLNLGTGNNTAYLNSTGEVFNITYTSSGWTIGNGSVYVNALGGLNWYYSAGGWTQDSTRFDFYKVTEKTDATTEITFTGISTGTTYTTVGNTTYKIVVEGGACIHNYAADTQEPTCETAGSTTYTCTLCGDSYTEEIPVLGHDYKTVTVEATCEKAGSVTTTCQNCGDKTEEAISALGHDYKTATVAATCEKAGSVTTACANCGDKTVEAIPALGHSYKTETVEATCTTDGGTVYTCTVCGHSYTADKIAAFGHAYTTVTVAAACETAGYVTKTCQNCGDKTVETVPALGHDYEIVTVAATCEKAGSVTKTCETCGDKTVETISALGHDYETVTVAATCEKAGSVTKTCATCGDKSVETISALGHDYKTTTVAATCEKNGSVTTACQRCGDKTVETVPALGHSYASSTVAPTCTSGGYTNHKCVACGDSYTSNQTVALGHSYTSTVVDATCTADGYTYHKCDICGNSYTSDQTAALGHTYTSQQVGDDMVYTCARCGHSYSETLAKSYTYDKVTSFANGQHYVITLYSNRKYYAVTHSNNTLSVKQVTVSGNKITTEITEDMLWDYSSSKLSYQSDGKTYYLYAQTSSSWWNSSTTLALSTTNSSAVSFSSSKLKVGSSYLRYSSSKVSLNRSATTTYLFKQNEQ